MEFNLQNSNKAEDKFIVAASNDRTPGARYIYDAKADTLTKLGDINPKIPEAQMSFMKPIQLHEPRRPHDQRLPHAAVRARAEEPARAS